MTTIKVDKTDGLGTVSHTVPVIYNYTLPPMTRDDDTSTDSHRNPPYDEPWSYRHISLVVLSSFRVRSECIGSLIKII